MQAPVPPTAPPGPDTLSVQVGGWFKASATGKGVFVIGVTLVVLAVLGLAQVWISLGR